MYLSVREVARTLHCSQGCIYRLVANGDLRHSRIGIGRGTIRIHERDLEAYLEQKSSDPKPIPVPRQNLREYFAPCIEILRKRSGDRWNDSGIVGLPAI